MPQLRSGLAAWLVSAAILVGAAPPLAAQDPADDDLLRESERPTKHFRVSRPAELSDAEAQEIYQRILADMTAGYGMAETPVAGRFSQWQRYNKTPYRSATHGERFVNNYANGIAKAYGLFEAAGTLPVGAVLAKDAYAVTDQGEVFIGPLFLMEKMPAGFNPPGRDWRYTMIMPDGSLFGQTKGQGSARVEFCITCHRAAGNKKDHLFFIPKLHRVVQEDQ